MCSVALLFVVSRSATFDDIFIDAGTHHSHEFSRCTGSEDHAVNLYFWDDLNGARLSRWRFGSRIGSLWRILFFEASLASVSGWCDPVTGEKLPEVVVGQLVC